MDKINSIFSQMESYKKSSRKTNEYTYNGVTYQKDLLTSIIIVIFMNPLLGTLFIIVYSELFGPIFKNGYWWIPIFMCIIIFVVLPMLIFIRATKKDYKAN